MARNHFSGNRERVKTRNIAKLSNDKLNFYLSWPTRFNSHNELFDLRLYFFKLYKSFAPDFENFRYLVHLNGNMNNPLVDNNSVKEITLNNTGFDDEKLLNKQGLAGSEHFKNLLKWIR